MNRAENIAKKLQVLSPSSLKVIDESEKHRGHPGNTGNGQSHYKIIISAENLKGKSLISQHRLINKLLEEEFANGLHALSINVIN